MRNTRLIHKYINDETCNTIVKTLIISLLDHGNPFIRLLHNITHTHPSLSLSDKPPTVRAELSCMSDNRYFQKRTYNRVLFQQYWLPVRFRSS